MIPTELYRLYNLIHNIRTESERAYYNLRIDPDSYPHDINRELANMSVSLVKLRYKHVINNEYI